MRRRPLPFQVDELGMGHLGSLHGAQRFVVLGPQRKVWPVGEGRGHDQEEGPAWLLLGQWFLRGFFFCFSAAPLDEIGGQVCEPLLVVLHLGSKFRSQLRHVCEVEPVSFIETARPNLQLHPGVQVFSVLQGGVHHGDLAGDVPLPHKPGAVAQRFQLQRQVRFPWVQGRAVDAVVGLAVVGELHVGHQVLHERRRARAPRRPAPRE
mmetsp:Transcript_60861/g.122130  ORF Transcript_60861/g.122130 Transcript_60861/m.122130 type:complete len:207 (+) Transcript_60861:810-1430(+)